MTFDELKSTLDAEVKAGTKTSDEAMTILARFLVTGSVEAVPAPDNVSEASDTSAYDIGNIPVDLSPVGSRTNASLMAQVLSPNIGREAGDAAMAEIQERARLKGLTFLEALTDGPSLARMSKTALKGPSDTVNSFMYGLPGLVQSVVGLDEYAQENFGEYERVNQGLNDALGVSDPIRAEESLAGVLTSAAVPGGAGVKAATVATDFVADQFIRELTTDQGDGYETVFNRAGVTDQDDRFNLPPLLAIPVALAGAVLTGKAVSTLKAGMGVKAPTYRDISDFDKFAPQDLQTGEISTDALNAYVISEEAALKRIVARAGIPNIDDINKKITLSGHAAAGVRAREGVNTGVATINGKTYRAPVAVKTLYDAAMAMPLEVRKKLERFINAKDALDDVRIAIAKKLPGNHAVTEARLLRDIAVAATGVPGIHQFETAYRGATRAVRDILEGDVLSTKARQYLDANRANYVPLDISPVDKKAPLLTRLNQTQREADTSPDDWFLQNRAGSGNYGLDARGNPFELLAGYTEAAMRLAMTNDAKLAIIDGMKNSSFGKKSVKLVDKDTNLAGNEDRIVEVYRAGEKERYLVPALQAQLMRFDPYVTKNPFFIVKRIAEWNMVGPGNPAFSAVNAIRDTIGGLVMRQEGLLAAGPLQVAAAVPKQLWARAQGAISNNIYAGLASRQSAIPEWLVSRQQKIALANSMSNNYINSLYHLSNTVGGHDSSAMRSNITIAQTAFGEMKRTLQDSTILHHPALDNMVVRFGKIGASSILSGYTALLDSVANSPRYAAIEKTVKAGGVLEDAATKARVMTGDMSQSGRVYRPDGKLMRADTVDQGVTSLVTPLVGGATSFIRNTAPFVNQAIQGTTNAITQFAKDPVGFMGRAWLYVGLPALTAYSVNEMLGPEYNEYAMNRRSATDVAMSTYIGVPGLPPEQGVEVPQIHELLLFGAPFVRTLHGLVTGENRDEMSSAMQSLGANIFSNSAEIGMPTFLSAIGNLTGQEMPSGIMGSDSGYAIREDNIGFLPQNIEQLARTLFATNGDTAIQTMYAMTKDSDTPFNDFLTTVYGSVTNRAPVMKNLSGRKAANVSFSMPAAYSREKDRAMEDFWPYYGLYFEQKNEDGLTMDNASSNFNPRIKVKGMTEKEYLPRDMIRTFGGYKSDEGAMGNRRDLPNGMIGPDQIPEPLNPLYKMFGETLAANLKRNGMGLSGLDERDSRYRARISQLRKYNAGDRKAIEEWQDFIENRGMLEDDSEKLRDWISQFDLDLEKYTDRVKLINIIENERSYVISQKLEVVSSVEEEISQQLIEQGLLQPGDRFRVEKHLNPMDADPFGNGAFSANTVPVTSPVTSPVTGVQ